MKIGILTLPIAENYGGILQAITLYKYLHNQKYDVTLIYKDTKPVKWKQIFRSVLLKIPFHDFKNIKTSDNREKWKKRKEFHRSFIEKHIFRISHNLHTEDMLSEYVRDEKFDAIIVGSDQVWRTTYKNDIYYKNYFLNFIESDKIIKKIAYAASFGKDTREIQNDEEEIANLLKSFTAVSVREKSGIDICNNNFHYGNAKHVLDPTFLMEKEFYIDNLMKKNDIKQSNESFLLTYILDVSKKNQDIIQNTKQILSIDNIKHLKGFSDSEIVYSIPEWLECFYKAKFIITDSFHGMVFSIIFQKDFLVIGNEYRGMDRFISLLSMLNLEDRLIKNNINLKNINLDSVDYHVVNLILNKEKKKSKLFLDSVLKDSLR